MYIGLNTYICVGAVYIHTPENRRSYNYLNCPRLRNFFAMAMLDLEMS